MIPLYLCEQGVKVHRDGEALLVKKDDTVVRRVLTQDLERVIAWGNIQFTTQSVGLLLGKGIPISLLTRSGELKGIVSPGQDKNIIRRVAQFRLIDNPEYCLAFSRSIMDAKLRNACEFLQRYHRHVPLQNFPEYRATVERLVWAITDAADTQALMGMEGFASRGYYHIFGLIIPGEFSFRGRNKRPPADPVNAILSLGYTILTGEIRSLIAAHGLDPGAGCYHALEYGRPSLAVDILEEFRAVVIDRFAVHLVKQRIVSPHDFELVEGKGCRFSREALGRFYVEYEKWMTRDLGLKEAVTWRDLLLRQVYRIAKAVDSASPYRPLLYGDADVSCGEL